MWALVHLFIFPGFLFLSLMGLIFESGDRMLYARMQNRKGPPWFQPIADFIKLVGKEDLIPDDANPLWFKVLPPLSIAAAVTTILYIPLWETTAVYSFEGDLIVVIYLLTIPTVCFFLAGWFSNSLYATIGAVRTLTQLFAYEVPLFMGLLAPAVFAGSWSISGIMQYYNQNPAHMLFNIVAFIVCLIALQGKLERVPFDIPEAETEIVGGAFTEYSGRYLAFFRMCIDIEAVVGSSIIAAVFLPFTFGIEGGFAGFLVYLVKFLLVLFLLAVMRTVVARIKIDQMLVFCWKYVAPAALLQLMLNVLLGGVITK